MNQNGYVQLGELSHWDARRVNFLAKRNKGGHKKESMVDRRMVCEENVTRRDVGGKEVRGQRRSRADTPPAAARTVHAE